MNRRLPSGNHETLLAAKGVYHGFIEAQKMSTTAANPSNVYEEVDDDGDGMEGASDSCLDEHVTLIVQSSVDSLQTFTRLDGSSFCAISF